MPRRCAQEDLGERVARFLAERLAGIVSRRDDEPVDICRFHRELADDFVAAFASGREVQDALARESVDLLQRLEDSLAPDGPARKQRVWRVVNRHGAQTSNVFYGGRAARGNARGQDWRYPDGAPHRVQAAVLCTTTTEWVDVPADEEGDAR